MSTSWYKSKTIPKLIQTYQTKHLKLNIEIWETTCIVTNFSDKANILINPANPSLSGVSKFPYFPRGGPEPKLPPTKDAHPIMGYVTSWGGMDVGNGMMFSANVVDGLVHQLGGKRLAQELQTNIQEQDRIKEGNAVWTSGVGDYQYLIHTVPPFYNSSRGDGEDDYGNDSNALLQKCYQSSLDLAIQKYQPTNNQKDIRLACPLLGAGCRGFSVESAIDHCIKGISNYDREESTKQDDCNITIAFGIPTLEVRSLLIESMDVQFNKLITS